MPNKSIYFSCALTLNLFKKWKAQGKKNGKLVFRHFRDASYLLAPFYYASGRAERGVARDTNKPLCSLTYINSLKKGNSEQSSESSIIFGHILIQKTCTCSTKNTRSRKKLSGRLRFRSLSPAYKQKKEPYCCQDTILNPKFQINIEYIWLGDFF